MSIFFNEISPTEYSINHQSTNTNVDLTIHKQLLEVLQKKLINIFQLPEIEKEIMEEIYIYIYIIKPSHIV